MVSVIKCEQFSKNSFLNSFLYDKGTFKPFKQSYAYDPHQKEKGRTRDKSIKNYLPLHWKSVKNRFFEKCSDFITDVMCVSGQAYRSCFVLKKVWRPILFSQKKLQKMIQKIEFFQPFGGGKKWWKMVKNGQKIDFLKSVQTLSPMSWVFEDRLTGLFSSSKRFGNHFCFRRKNRKKWSKNRVFSAFWRG